MRWLLPLVLAVLGLAAGLGAGLYLRPPPDEAPTAEVQPRDAPPAPGSEVLRLPGQFLIPVIGEGRVRAIVTLSLALDLRPGHGILLARDEPRLRAGFLQILFDHANLGGFDGQYTSGEHLLALRRRLLEAARHDFGEVVQDVLIVDLVHQEN